MEEDDTSAAGVWQGRAKSFQIDRISGWIGYEPRDWGVSLGFRWSGWGTPDYSIVQIYFAALCFYGEIHFNEW